MRKKITKLSLEELAKVMPVMPEWEMKQIIGGRDGSYSNTYTYQNYLGLSISGSGGSYVDISGYVHYPDGGTSGSSSTGVSGSSSITGYIPFPNYGYNDPSGIWGSDPTGSMYPNYNYQNNNDSSIPTYGGGGGSYSYLNDGINVALHNFAFSTNTGQTKAFHEQLINILKSNSVIKKMLAYPNNGNTGLIFEIGNIASPAQLYSEFKPGGYKMTFNANLY